MLVVTLPACVRKQHQLPKNSKQISIKVDGVECPVCARTAMRQLKLIENVTQLQFVAPSGDFEQGEFICIAPHNTPQFFNHVHTQLLSKNFGLKEVSGTFIGRVNPRNIGRSLSYEIIGWHQPFIIRGTNDLIESLFNSYIVSKQPAVIKGKLTFDHHMQLYEFYPAIV